MPREQRKEKGRIFFTWAPSGNQHEKLLEAKRAERAERASLE
jgi:hypothetical protein